MTASTAGWTEPSRATQVSEVVLAGLSKFRAAAAAATAMAVGLACVAVVGAIGGLALGWVELDIAAALSTTLLALAALFTVGRARHSATLTLSAQRVTAGEPATGTAVVLNDTARRLLPVSAELHVGRGVALIDVPALGPKAEIVETFGVPTRRRGVIAVGPLGAVRGDPLRIFRREQMWTEAFDLIVHPRTVGLRGTAAGFLRDLEGQVAKTVSNHDVAFHALRPYVSGDDRRYIHWRTSARTGQIMVRQFEETRRSYLAVLQSTAGSDYVDEDEFELAVSVTGSLGLQALREDHTLSVLVSDPVARDSGPGRSRELRTASPQGFLDQLAAVEQAPSAAPVDALARATAAKVVGVSVVVIVAGSPRGLADLTLACSRFPADVRTMAVRCAPNERARVSTMGAYTIITTDRLDSLPRLVHQAAAR